MGQAEQAGTDAGVVPVARGHGEVQLEPAVEHRVGRGPDEGAVVRIPGGQHPAGAQHAAELHQRGHRVGEMLEHLV